MRTLIIILLFSLSMQAQTDSVLTATPEQYEQLNGYENGNSKLIFTKDAEDRWIVGRKVLSDPSFAAIREELEQLEVIKFEPKETEL